MRAKRKVLWELDPLGRIMIPTEWRQKKVRRIEISIHYGHIVLQPYDATIDVKERAFIGLVRECDYVGRVVIPKEMLQVLEIQPKTQMGRKQVGPDKVYLIPKEEMDDMPK